jgi:hypothetical protein
MTTTVTLTPNEEVLVSGTTFTLKPTATKPLYSAEVRSGLDPVLYETINPSLSIEVVAAGICPPIPPGTPNLITGISLSAGQSFASGKGCSILEGPVGVTDLPEFSLPLFNEPQMEYGSITFPPPGVPTGILVAPLKGYYSEKYFYDQEYIFSTYYETQTPSRFDKLTYVDLINGNKTIPLTELTELLAKADNGRINKNLFPGDGKNVLLNSIANDDSELVVTSGNQLIEGLTADVSAWIKMKPSEIVKMTYYYVLTVTHTCPPYITRFYGSMVVNNNWDPVQKRLAYYLNKATGIIPDPK